MAASAMASRVARAGDGRGVRGDPGAGRRGGSSFSASIDRAAVAPEQPFVYRVTLSTPTANRKDSGRPIFAV